MTRRRRWFLPTLLVGLALIALGATFAGAQGDDQPRGSDPISTDEQTAALEAAGAPAATGGDAGPESGASDDVVLLVERHEEAKADEDEGLRRADVFVYSYDDDTLTRTLVDLESNEVVDTESTQNVQLPLIESEGDRAIELALDDAEFEDQLATEYRTATGRELADPATDLQIEPIVFKADAMPTAATGPAAQCGLHRCAQLMIQTTDNVLVNLLPIVDLSSDQLIARNGFFQ